MIDKAKAADLAGRCAAAHASAEVELVKEAWELIYPGPEDGQRLDMEALLEAPGGVTDVAVGMVPPFMRGQLDWNRGAAWHCRIAKGTSPGQTFALAITGALLCALVAEG